MANATTALRASGVNVVLGIWLIIAPFLLATRRGTSRTASRFCASYSFGRA